MIKLIKDKVIEDCKIRISKLEVYLDIINRNPGLVDKKDKDKEYIVKQIEDNKQLIIDTKRLKNVY